MVERGRLRSHDFELSNETLWRELPVHPLGVVLVFTKTPWQRGSYKDFYQRYRNVLRMCLFLTLFFSLESVVLMMGLSAQDDECKFRHGVNDPRDSDISPPQV